MGECLDEQCALNKVADVFLTATTAVVGGLELAAVAVPFINLGTRVRKAKAAGAPVEVDISKLEEGQMVRVEWRGKPVGLFVVRKQVLMV